MQQAGGQLIECKICGLIGLKVARNLFSLSMERSEDDFWPEWECQRVHPTGLRIPTTYNTIFPSLS